ncbi:hypothetical protein SKAU_G00137740 [Synaphobranchus kaupii]|uniref:Uncharacterized protein n=1 Tax=Synaphobranchus kaupii TaxID=118154 RepID=A0A9Q1FSP9_SYNKA|nr:hypothetical protein SKAU_G00137740 [Synaphobranchus kaupii]
MPIQSISEEEDILPAGQDTGEGSGVEPPIAPRFREVISRAAKALDISLPESTRAPPSRFEDSADARPAPVVVPLLPDFGELL